MRELMERMIAHERRRAPRCRRGGARAHRRARSAVAGDRVPERSQHRPRRRRGALAALPALGISRGSSATARPRLRAAAARRHRTGADRLPPRAYATRRCSPPNASSCCVRRGRCSGTRRSCARAGDLPERRAGGERALVVRAERGRLHAFRNACRRRPHALVTRTRAGICKQRHSLRRRIRSPIASTVGLVAGATPGDLTPLELRRSGRLMLVRAAGAPGAGRRGRTLGLVCDAGAARRRGARRRRGLES